MPLCHHCGTKYGKVMLTKMTFKEDKCSCCNSITNVTDEMNYGYPNYPGNTFSPEVRQILQNSIDFRRLSDGRKKMSDGTIVDPPDYQYFSDFPG